MLPSFNPGSSQMLSILFFGGKINVEVAEPLLDVNGCPIVFKSGKNTGTIKTKKVKKEIQIKGLGLKPLTEWAKKKEGIYSVDEAVLKLLSKGTGEDKKDAKEIADIMLQIRGLEKELKTYYNGIEELTYDVDSCVHANFNMVATETGRLSSNKPNLQNITGKPSKVKQIFISRY